ncbi:uncharacterized protein LOC114714992 [Neltuma alba]|uniref:uncharacterized protein LOC114714992 n=1 Tax=Neltuma alba TaxID=207710 RepID=UPI0010A583F5|nr:uncharacterized protein LOC114714992 [Prosopis alba]XP_028755617.1 uncharacterized protein LOC114714992 [Prosopis alba]XP_028755618.1 uncharacterized protein LOC114714992 [Prosopis alba]XP_028755619.1 uncharacterized protein LOC114714992 [Prosopis alba]
MNNSSLGGRFLSNPSGGMLDLESPFHRHQHAQLGHPSMTSQNQMTMLSGLEKSHPVGLLEVKGSNPTANFSKGKAPALTIPTNSDNMSEEDEPSDAEDANCENYDGGKNKKRSPWQRMKWTDNVVRLLIGVVACVGDDGTIQGMDGHRRRSGCLQKKGKWKTVSKIMMKKGCHVSPQQCEDKFNDLNKRYKKLNDILGRGTSCRVVENPAMMDSMPNLSAKTKDVVRKILSSKHLFYKEMCAYHNGQRIPNCHNLDLHSYSLQQGRDSRDNDDSEEEGEDLNESEDDELDNEGNHNARGDAEIMEGYSGKNNNDSDDRGCPQSARVENFEAEMAGIFQDPLKSGWERSQWVKIQMLQLQEQRVTYQAQGLELEKQHFKWLRYCSKKNRELERLRLENERMKLENERQILQLKQKGLDSDFRRSEMSIAPFSIGTSRMQGGEQMDLGRQL